MLREGSTEYLQKNSVATKYPELAKEWNYEKNEGLVDNCDNDISTPDKMLVGTSLKVWWKCSKGHEWESFVSSRAKGVGCPYCSGRKALAGVNDFATMFPEIASEWHFIKNYNVSPTDLTPKSEKKVWWKCKECGYEWQAKVCDRVKDNECPCCANIKAIVIADVTAIKVAKRTARLRDKNLVTTHPELLRDWNYKKNEECGYTPYTITFGSNTEVWWQCSRGHEWRASVCNRVHGTGCPYCSGRKFFSGYNDLSITHPDLCEEWNYEQNEIKPTEISFGSTEKVWWRCKECGYEWQARVNNRVHGSGCPRCTGRKGATTSCKPVLCVETGIVYPSLGEAAKKTGIDISSIVNVCKKRQHRKTAGGYHWKYARKKAKKA